MIQALQIAAGVASVIVMTCALYGWGRMTRRFAMLPPGTWPVSTTLGMATIIFIGGILNLVRLAFPAVLAAIIVAGLAFALRAVLSNANPLQTARFSQSKPWLLAWGICCASLTGLAIATQLAPALYNLFDDLQHFFGHSVRMVQTGTLYGSPLNALGGEVLGAQAFLQAFVIGYFPLKFINAADAVFCFFLCLALAGSVGFGRPLVGPAALIGTVAVFIIDPLYVNISSLFSTAAVIAALMIITVDEREGGENVALPWRQAAAPALFCAAAIALKNTGIVFIGLLLTMWALTSFRKSDWQVGVYNTAKISVWTCIFLAPWLLLYLPYYITGFEHPLGAPPTPVPQSMPEVRSLFSSVSTRNGASRLAFTFLASTLLICAGYAILRARHESEQRRKALTALASGCAAAAGTYLFWMIVGPHLQEQQTTMRYAVPVLIGACAVALPLWTALTNRRNAAMCIAVAATLLIVFAAPTRERLSSLYHQKTALAYIRGDSRSSIARNQHFMQMLDKDPLSVRQLQKMIPAREPLLVWIETPFLLDYTRNEIIDMNTAGFSQAWGHISVPRYVLWQSSGYGIDGPSNYELIIRRAGRRSGLLAARGLEVFLWLQAIAPRSKIIANQNGVILFETDANTPPPPDDDGAVKIAAKK